VGVVDGPAGLEEEGGGAAFPVSLLDAGDMGTSSSIGVVTLRPGATLEDLRTQLDALPDSSVFGIDPAADWVPEPVRRAVSAQGQGLAVMTGIAAAATIVVLGQMLSRQVRLPEPERLVLRAMGMDRRQVAADPVLAAAVPVTVGMVAAVVIAALASGLFPNGFVRHVEPHPGLRVDAATLLPGAFVLASAATVWVVLGVLSTRRTSRPARPGVVDAIARRAPARAATGLRFAFVRQSRDGGGPVAALAGMVFVLGIGVGALTFGASLGRLVHRPIGWGTNFDIGLGGQGGGAIPEEAVEVAASSPDVEALALFGTTLTSVGAEQFQVVGLQPVRGSVAPPVIEGRLPQGSDEIALGRLVADHFGVGVGDPLTVTGPAGERTLTVSGLAVITGIDGVEGVGQDGLVTLDGLRQLDAEAVATAGGIRLRPGAPPDAAQRLASALGLEGLGEFSRPAVIVNAGRVRTIPYLIAGVLGALALLNLVHQLIVSTHRRRQDIAVLRALGAGSRWVSGVVHWQVSLFTLVVLAVSAPAGIIAGQFVYRAFVDRIGALDTVTLPLALLAAAAVGLVLLANVVATPNAMRARRLPPSVLVED
jgi:hypothetical protein